jgi:hypothetical protein
MQVLGRVLSEEPASGSMVFWSCGIVSAGVDWSVRIGRKIASCLGMGMYVHML